MSIHIYVHSLSEPVFPYLSSAQSSLSPACSPLQVEPVKKTSDWKEFTAPDGRKYYYNSTTKVSSWTMPDELKKGSETPSAAKASPAAHGTPSIQVQPGIPGHHACDAKVVETAALSLC